MKMINNENRVICAECGGKCCQYLPGTYSPEQFGAPDVEAVEQHLFDAFVAGTAQVDWYDGDPRPQEQWEDEDGLSQAYYIRPPTKTNPKAIYHPAWNGEVCLLLTPSGCSLSFDERPVSCQTLNPTPDAAGGCRANEGHPDDYNQKQDFSIQWLPYADVIDRAAKRAEKQKG